MGDTDRAEWENIVSQPFPRTDKEQLVPPGSYVLEQHEQPRQPESELQALMETPPDGTSRWEGEPSTELVEQIAKVIGQLSEEELAVIECTVFGSHSIRTAADLLGWPKTTVHRLKVSALRRIKFLLENIEKEVTE